MTPTLEEKRKGLIIVHTGTGKGKTTAALGLALCAVGSGHPLPAEPPGTCLGEAMATRYA